MKRLLITFVLSMLLCAGAQAIVDLSADFETPPYNIAPINGQQGWYGSDSTVAVVADGTAPSGSQVLNVAGIDDLVHNAIAYPNADQDLVKMSVWFNGPMNRASNPGIFLRQGSTYFVWGELVASYNYGFYNIYGDWGNQYAGAGGARFRWNSGEWNKLEIWLDLANDQYAVEVNDVLATEWYTSGGALIGSWIWTPFDNLVSKLDTIQFFGKVKNDANPSSPMLIDALVVEEGLDAIPEPSMYLLGLGLLAICRKRS